MSDFEQRVSHALHAHLTQREEGRSLTPLAAILGCRVLGTGGKLLPAAAIEPTDESLVAKTLFIAFRSLKEPASWANFDRFAILDGLVKNNRWRQCLGTKDDIDLLVSILLRFSPGSGYMYRDMQGDINALLNDWLSPDPKIEGRPSMEQVVGLFYGPVWWSLCVESKSEPSAMQIMKILAHTHAPYCEAIYGASTPMESLPNLESA